MLSPADTALCERDRALPGLAAVLDARQLARDAGLGKLRAHYVRYKPGTSCIVGMTSEDGVCRGFAAMSYPPARYAEVRARTSWWAEPDAVLYFDDICTALVPLSRDRRLKAARMLRMPADRLRFLDRLGLEGAELTLLRYKPGRRLVMRADTSDGMTAVIKSHGERDFAAAAAGARHAERVVGASLICIAEPQRSVVSRWIDGKTLNATSSETDLFHSIGVKLALLHQAALPFGAPRANWHPRPDVRALAALLPGLAVASEAASAAVAQHLEQLEPIICTIHGDFSADQVVISNGEPIVIDWDRFGAGHPGRDLGSFLARLDVDVIEGALPASAADAAGQALLDGYAGSGGGLPPGIGAFRAAALLALLPEGFRQRRPEWSAEAEAILVRVAALTDEQQPKRRPVTPGLADALDHAMMAPRLAAALNAVSDTQLPVIQLLRHKPGRRALLRYDLEGRVPMLGKLRAKGPDRRTPALHGKLREAGLDGRAPSFVGVPEPLGEITAPPIWLQRVVSGRLLTTCLTPGGAADAARCAGRGLAVLHDAPVTADRTWSMADELAVLDRALIEAATAQDQLAEGIGQIRARARASMNALTPVEFTGIHRDFYPDQVMIDKKTVWLLDLDLFAHGDPMIDIGNFLAHLDELGLRLYGDVAALASHATAFLAGYEEKRTLDRQRINSLRLISLARHIQLSRIIPGRGHTTTALIRHCAATFAAATIDPHDVEGERCPAR